MYGMHDASPKIIEAIRGISSNGFRPCQHVIPNTVTEVAMPSLKRNLLTGCYAEDLGSQTKHGYESLS